MNQDQTSEGCASDMWCGRRAFGMENASARRVTVCLTSCNEKGKHSRLNLLIIHQTTKRLIESVLDL